MIYLVFILLLLLHQLLLSLSVPILHLFLALELSLPTCYVIVIYILLVLMDFVNLFYSISVLVSIFFLCITLNFCLIAALTKKWSESIFGPLIELTSSITPFLFAFIII